VTRSRLACASNCCRARTEARRTRRCGQQSLDRPSPGPPSVQGSALASQRKKSRQRAPVAPRGSSPRRPAFLMRPLAESGRKQLDQMTRLPSAPAEDADDSLLWNRVQIHVFWPFRSTRRMQRSHRDKAILGTIRISSYASSTSTRKTVARFSIDDRCYVRSR
jgi:hypothetical protein